MSSPVNRPLMAAAALGMVVTFGAGWAVGHSGDDEKNSAERTVATPAPVMPPTPAPTESSSTDGSGDAMEYEQLDDGSGEEVGTAAARAKLPAVNKWKKAPIGVFTCPKATVKVATSDQLQKALDTAEPGASIQLADGLYNGEFRTTRDGSAAKPIYLCGSRNAVIDAGAIKGGYALHFDGATNWRVDGFTVRNGQKGVMVDRGRGIGLQNLLVERIGDEAVHLRTSSRRNVVRGLTIRDTGNRKPKFGEGIYIGTAESNWCEYTDCKPDPSNDNFILNNRISGTTAENVDIKEGTSGGVLNGNRFDGSAMTEGDSWVDVKGNGWLISGNIGVDSRADGYKVIEILDGWGWRNLFSANRSTVRGNGYAINVTKRHSGNVVRCNNTARNAGEGASTVKCRK
ncbi:right-handed parallel beta-helix repeat-containing protein [Kineosporia babensis]|uniref:Right handed beta helix domain-containing protein n=1 Tax=Kineosporia babensis TaxID=499548 RepID=A0A9X1NG58_9ACTN|nr:right-handed parallel beta-helix repeat-containing protein [Kineosporia babensis]MCD5313201.1 hypothetical protein [Kineosporia babensis]